MIDDIYQAGTDQALDDQLQRPKPFKPAASPFSITEFLGQGIAKPAAAGFVARPIAFGADMAGAFGDVLGAGGFNQGGMFSTPTDEERKQQEAARRKLLESGPGFSSEGGDIFRERARQLMPDPQTTHAATQVAAGVSEFMGNAVLYAATTGPVAPFLVAGDAALSEADKLKQQGVDLGTRTAAGAVAGLSAGVAVALPVVGKTVAQTAGLVLAGGPGGFVAQNAAERAILANAGYDKLASQYDPLDPVGLALSTLVPAGFGAVALRARSRAAPTLKDVVLGIESNGQRYDKNGNILTSPKGAKGEMQVMDGTNLDPGFGVRPAADSSPAERARVGSDYLDAMLARYGSEDKAMAAYNAGPGAVDKALAKGGDWLSHLPAETQAYVAKGMKRLGEGRTDAAARASIARDPDVVAAARVRQTSALLDSYRLTSDTDLAGMTAHQDAIEAAHAQLARGDVVSVSDIVALNSVRTGRLLDDQIATAEALRADQLGVAGNLADAGVVRGLRAELDALQAARPDDSSAAIKARAKQLQASDQLSYKQAQSAAQKEIAGQLATHTAQLERVNGLLSDNARAQQATETVGRLDDQLATMRAQRGNLDLPASSPRMLAFALAEAFPPRAFRAATAGAEARQAPRATGRQLLDAAGESAVSAPASTSARQAPTTPRAAAADGVTAPDARTATALDAQSAEIAGLDPDLMVQLEGMDKPMRVSELLETVKREADEEAQGASLVDVAANCFLRSQ